MPYCFLCVALQRFKLPPWNKTVFFKFSDSFWSVHFSSIILHVGFPCAYSSGMPFKNEQINNQSIRKPTLRCPCVVSTGRPPLSQVMLGGGMPLEMHSKLMGLWRTTDRSAGPVVRMDGGTGEMKRIVILLKTLCSKFGKKDITKRQKVGAFLWLAFKAQITVHLSQL